MKYILLNLALLFAGFGNIEKPIHDSVGMGEQPQLSVDVKGRIRIAFGRNDSIFCVTSADKGTSFSKAKFVGKVDEMHLGMTRGPQIASSDNVSLITAIDKQGNIHSFLLNHLKDKWIQQSFANDIKASAPEGLMGLAADKQDNFYAVWLDIRKEKKNNIYFSSFNGKGSKWTRNKLVYASPDEHVCECCKPSIAVQGSKVAVMFRNWLNGSRDLYTAISNNKGNDFASATKLGNGTWKLNGCPMDGGGVAIDKGGNVHTVWRREGVVYYAKPNEAELEIGKGKICSISTNNEKVVLSMQDGGNTKLIDLNSHIEATIGKGAFLKSVVLSDGKVICVWEDEDKINFKTM